MKKEKSIKEYIINDISTYRLESSRNEFRKVIKKVFSTSRNMKLIRTLNLANYNLRKLQVDKSKEYLEKLILERRFLNLNKQIINKYYENILDEKFKGFIAYKIELQYLIKAMYILSISKLLMHRYYVSFQL